VKIVRALILAGPLLMVAAGVYIMIQPVVVTQVVSYSYSNTPGLLLLLLGAVFGLVAAMLVTE
jgi:hypothetical protein